MVNAPASPDIETLGQFLQRQRIEKGVDLQAAAEETRIPLGTLQAMEKGDFAALPAEAFARGFYSIYGRLLKLDTDNILEQYTKERSSSLRYQKKTAQTPSRLGKQSAQWQNAP